MKKIVSLWSLLLICVFTASEVLAVEDWAVRYNGPLNRDDFTSAVAVDKSGNIYVTGASMGSGTSWDYATIKYLPGGTMKWLRRHNGNWGSLGSRVDCARAIAVDNDANVYVTGDSSGENGYRGYFTIKYDNDKAGTYMWGRRYSRGKYSTACATALAVDRSGNVYVTGYTYPPWSSTCDITTVKYDGNGLYEWAKHYASPWDGVDDKPVAIAVDRFGGVYVAGYSPGLKYQGSKIMKTGRDFVLIKYDGNGNLKWAKRYNGPANQKDEPKGLKVVSKFENWSAVTNIYVTGYSVGNGTEGDYATLSYDRAGNQTWLQRYNGPAAYPDVTPVAVGVDSQLNVYVTGSGLCPSEYITLKYDANGTLKWTRRFHMGQHYDLARAMAVDANGNVYVTGQSHPPDGSSFDIVTIKYDTGGNLKWTEQYNGPGNGYDEPTGIAVDSSGNVYVTGRSLGDGTFDDYVTLKYPAH